MWRQFEHKFRAATDNIDYAAPLQKTRDIIKSDYDFSEAIFQTTIDHYPNNAILTAISWHCRTD